MDLGEVADAFDGTFHGGFMGVKVGVPCDIAGGDATFGNLDGFARSAQRARCRRRLPSSPLPVLPSAG